MATLPEAKLYIDGVLRGAEGGKTFDVIGPWTGEPVGTAAPLTKPTGRQMSTCASRW